MKHILKIYFIQFLSIINQGAHHFASTAGMNTLYLGVSPPFSIAAFTSENGSNFFFTTRNLEKYILNNVNTVSTIFISYILCVNATLSRLYIIIIYTSLKWTKPIDYIIKVNKSFFNVSHFLDNVRSEPVSTFNNIYILIYNTSDCYCCSF